MKSPCDSLNPFLTTQCWWILILFSCHGLYVFCFLQPKIGNHSFILGDSPEKDGSILKHGWEGTYWFFSKKECMLVNLCLHPKDFFRRLDAVCDLEIRALLLGDPPPPSWCRITVTTRYSPPLFPFLSSSHTKTIPRDERVQRTKGRLCWEQIRSWEDVTITILRILRNVTLGTDEVHGRNLTRCCLTCAEFSS